MKSYRAMLIFASFAALTACGSEPPEERASESDRQQALRDSAFGSLTETMDRAAEVEQLQLDRKRELDAALDQ